MIGSYTLFISKLFASRAGRSSDQIQSEGRTAFFRALQWSLVIFISAWHLVGLANPKSPPSMPANPLEADYTTSWDMLLGYGTIDLDIREGVPPYMIDWEGAKTLSLSEFNSLITSLNAITNDPVLANIDFSGFSYSTYLQLAAKTSKTRLEAGIHNITVRDQTGDAVNLEVYLGQSMSFQDVSGATYIDNELLKTASAGWGNVTTGANHQLGANQNGWLQFSVPATSHIMAMGWIDANSTDRGYNKLDFAFYVDQGTMKIMEQGVFATETTPISASDRFAINRQGNVIKYTKNGVVLRTTTCDPLKVLLTGVDMYSGGAKLSDLNTDAPAVLEPKVIISDASCAFAGSGSAVLGTLWQNTSKYSYSWSNGSTDYFANSLTPGNYSVTVTSPWNPSGLVANFTVANEVTWQSFNNTAPGFPNSNTLTKNNGSSDWNGSADSRNSLEQTSLPFSPFNYWTEFTVQDQGLGTCSFCPSGQGYPYRVQFGFWDVGTDHGYRFLVVHTTNQQKIILSHDPNNLSVPWQTIGVAHNGDVLRMEYATASAINCQAGSITGNVNFYKNGQLLHTYSGANLSCHLISGNIYYQGLEIEEARTNLGCEGIDQYAELKKKPDGGYMKVIDGRLRFKYVEEYPDEDGSLDYIIFDNLHEDVTANSGNLTPGTVSFGDNRFSLDVSGLPPGYYLLEVANEKNERNYLRFKNQ